jgi:hypothetical protein
MSNQPISEGWENYPLNLAEKGMGSENLRFYSQELSRRSLSMFVQGSVNCGIELLRVEASKASGMLLPTPCRGKLNSEARTKFSALIWSTGGSDSRLTRLKKQMEGKIIPRKEHNSVINA